MYGLGRQLDLAKFFTVIGCLLIFFAAACSPSAVQTFQELGWLRVLDIPMWHTGRVLSEDSAFGDVLHSSSGTAIPTPPQLLVHYRRSGDRDSDVPRACERGPDVRLESVTSQCRLITSGRAHAFGPY